MRGALRLVERPPHPAPSAPTSARTRGEVERAAPIQKVSTPVSRWPLSGYDRAVIEPEQPQQDKYVETARDRRIANALLLFFLIVVVGGGIWLANAMFEQRRLDDCLAQGGRNCAPAIEAPAR